MTRDSHDGDLQFFATAAKGAETLLADEVRTIAAEGDPGDAAVAQERGGVSFDGPLALGYRVCLWSRLAQRVLLRLATLPLDGGAGRLLERPGRRSTGRRTCRRTARSPSTSPASARPSV